MWDHNTRRHSNNTYVWILLKTSCFLRVVHVINTYFTQTTVFKSVYITRTPVGE